MDVAPIVMPPNVILTAVLAAALPDCNVSTMLDAPLAVEFAVATPLTLTVAGVTPAAKKPDGKFSVMVSLGESLPPADVLKPKVTGTPCWFTTRNAFEI